MEKKMMKIELETYQVNIKFLAALFVLLTARVCPAAENSWQFQAAAALEVEADAGEVVLGAAQGSSISVKASGDYDPVQCFVTAQLKADAVHVSAKSKRTGWRGWFANSKACNVHLDISAPRSTRLRVASGAGRVAVTGFTSGAVLNSGAGAIEMHDLAGPLDIHMGAGPIKGDIFSEDLKVESGAGGLDIAWSKSPKKGTATIKAGAGSARLVFPDGTRIKAEYAGGGFDYKNELGDDPAAAFKVIAKIGAGGLHIVKALSVRN